MKPKVLWSLAVIGLILFVYFQLVPSLSPGSSEAGGAVSKEQAIRSAADFARGTLQFTDIRQDDADVTYTTFSDVYGYLSKENLLDKYDESYGKSFPTEMFRVRFKQPDDHLESLYVDVNMRDGNVVGFDAGELYSINTKEELLKSAEGTSKVKSLEGDLTEEEKEQLAEPYALALGFKSDQLQPDTSSQTGLVYDVQGYKTGEAQGQLIFYFEYNNVSSMQAKFSVPESHTDYVAGQSRLASWLTYGGYALFSFILGILAIVYSARTRPHASFKRGIFLTLFYLFINVVSTFNMMPVYESEGISGIALTLALGFQLLYTLVMTASIYFSLVGGDGLWKQKGRNLWPRFREEGYGDYVLKSALNGYAWAFILLGVQTLIYIVLGLTLHTWTTTDETQSAYNMVYPWLFPLMAWMAGIGEEAVYRLFGIPMLKKIFRSTFIASLISTLIWAFGHTLYPVYPVVSRPIELTFIGLLFSFIFLRQGYIAVMFAHVVFDSLLLGLSVLLMGGAANIIIGIVTFAMPALAGYVVYLLRSSKRSTPGTPADRTRDGFNEGESRPAY
ncbi:CPBP family intramembrane glutamic endopeptidase [Paenibacillus pinistramenti]|uniref:CPBP family intramembrane glutamic endopeptidase n=1 Tax=Paenibacillus pinistramenti TaxID=1768003 RepID=UPI001109624C|nr:type II CAAX endopeptidase family protein [Paenibacillus pinistramenti]